MDKEIDLIRYVPPVIGKIREFNEIFNVENDTLLDLQTGADIVFDNQFIYDAHESGIARWEKLLNIYPKSTDTLEDRRFTVLNRLNAKLPYTYRTLEQRLITLCGEKGFTMKFINEIMTLQVRVSLSQKRQYNELLNTIKDIVPANIAIDYDYMYNTHEMLDAYTHQELSKYTHIQLKEVNGL